MTIVSTIIERGYAKSAAARIDTIAVAPELVARVGQCLREMFQIMKRENINLIGIRAAVAFNGTGWPRPVDALAVIDVHADAGTIAAPPIPIGTEIVVVSYDDQGFHAGVPCVTELGQQFIPTGQSIDPSNGTLTLTYARAPIIPTLATDAVDPFFPEAFDDLLQFDIAAYLAVKDQRQEDETAFLGFKNALVQQFVDWARAQTYSLEQRHPMITPPLTNVDGGRQAPGGK